MLDVVNIKGDESMTLEQLATATFWGAELIFALLVIYSWAIATPAQIGLGLIGLGFFVAFGYLALRLR